VRQARDVFERLQDTGRRLIVDHRDELAAPAIEGGGERVRLQHTTPLAADGDDFGAAAFGDLGEQQAKRPHSPTTTRPPGSTSDVMAASRPARPVPGTGKAR